MNIVQLETLIEEGNLDALTTLLTAQPDLAEKQTSQGVSPVFLAAYYKKPHIAQAIAKFVQHLSLHEACAIGDLDRVTLLLQENNMAIDQFSPDGFTPVALAVFFGHAPIVDFLLSKNADVNIPAANGYNVYPLHMACAANNLSIVVGLLKAGADVNVKQLAGLTPLHAAAEHGNIEMIIALLEYGANTEIRMEGGKLPADLAEENGFAEIAGILRQ